MFSTIGTYEAVGLFSKTHIIAMIMCFVFVGVAVICSRKMTKVVYFKLLKILAVIFTIMESVKIAWSVSKGYTGLDSWMPLYFCSLFLYSLWFAGFGKGKLRDIGLSFIAYGCIIAGAVFIICPSSSFRIYPIFHYLCIYSMIYHSFMLYIGIMFFVARAKELNFKSIGDYAIFCAIFMNIAIVLNCVFKCNLMFLDNPVAIPLNFLMSIYNFSQILYIIVMIIAHLLMSVAVFGIYALTKYIKRKVSNQT